MSFKGKAAQPVSSASLNIGSSNVEARLKELEAHTHDSSGGADLQRLEALEQKVTKIVENLRAAGFDIRL